MQLIDAAQIAVLRGPNRRNPFPMYVTEILEIEGFCYQLVDLPAEQFDLLIVPDIELTTEQRGAVEAFAKSGGNLLALRPPTDLLGLFGLKVPEGSSKFAWADRYLRLRDETVLQFHGPADLLHLAGADALAWLQYDFEDAPSQHPAVVRTEDGGRRAAFTFDLARAVVLFHQGRSDQAGDGPSPDPDGDGMFKPNDLFINYLDGRCKLIPQADVLQDLLIDLIYWLTERTDPIPRLWHFPDAQPAIAFMNGDSDGGSFDDFNLAFDTATSYGSKYTLYLMTQDFEKLSAEAARALQATGHNVCLHPWGGPAPTVEEFRKYLHDAHSEFQERYGYLPATVRNHSIIIAGWVDTPMIYREIGLRMDLNVYTCRLFQYGFQSGTGLPVKLMNRDGALVDFYQQATLHSDDCLLEAKTTLPAKTAEEAVGVSVQLLDDLIHKYHGVYQPCFHPIRLRSAGPPAIEWFRAVLGEIRSRGMTSVSGQEWCEFNDARRSVKISWQAGSWLVSSERPVRGLTILWPERVRSVRINGSSHALTSVAWGGITSGWTAVDIAPGEVLTMEEE